MNKKHNLKDHPAQKSLTVFPIIPKRKSLVGCDSLTSEKATKAKKLRINFEQKQPFLKFDKDANIEKVQTFKNTKLKLERVSNKLPQTKDESIYSRTPKLPPIISCDMRSSTKIAKGKRQLPQEGR